jgi:hypothetical protein
MFFIARNTDSIGIARKEAGAVKRYEILKASKTVLDCVDLSLIVILIVIDLSCLQFLVLVHKICPDDELLFDVFLLVVIVQLLELFEVILSLVILHAEAPVIFSRNAVFIGFPLAILAELLDSLRIEAVFYQCVQIISSVDEIVMPAQLTAILVLDGNVVEGAGVNTILHNLEVLVLSGSSVLAFHVPSNVVFAVAPVITQVAALPLAIELFHLMSKSINEGMLHLCDFCRIVNN